MRATLLAILLVLACVPAYAQWFFTEVGGGPASTFQILTSSNVGDVPSGDDWAAANGAAKGSLFSNVASCDENAQPIPVAGTAEELRCYSVTPVPTGTTITMKLVKATGTDSDLLTCTMVGDDTAQECVSAGTGNISAEDTICMQGNGSIATTNAVGCTWTFTPTTADEFITLGGITAPSTTLVRRSTVNGVYTNESDAQQAEAAWPIAGDFTKFCASTATTVGTGSYALVLQEDEIDGISVTLNAANCSSSYPCVVCATGTMTVAEGSDIQVEVTPATSPTAAEIMYGAVFEPTTAGQFVFSVATDATWPTASSKLPLMGGDPLTSAGSAEPPHPAYTIKKLCAQWEDGGSLSAGTCTADLEIDGELTRTVGGLADISVQMDSGENLQCATVDVAVTAGQEVAFEVSCVTPTGAGPYSLSLVGEE